MANDNVKTVYAPKTPIKTRPKDSDQPDNPKPNPMPGTPESTAPKPTKPKPQPKPSKTFDDPDAERMPTDAEAAAMRNSYKKGGSVESKKSDMAQDKKMIASMIHKHEKRDHPGKSLTKFKAGGSASRRGDGIAQRGKTRGKMV